jgi:hypothetical protein
MKLFAIDEVVDEVVLQDVDVAHVSVSWRREGLSPLDEDRAAPVRCILPRAARRQGLQVDTH